MTIKHLSSTFIIALFLIATTSCVKEPDIIIDKPHIISEEFVWANNSVRINGEYEYQSKLKTIYVYVSTSNAYNDNIDPISAGIVNNTFSVLINNISQKKNYFYYYKLVTSDGEVLTEIKPFKKNTQSQ